MWLLCRRNRAEERERVPRSQVSNILFAPHRRIDSRARGRLLRDGRAIAACLIFTHVLRTGTRHEFRSRQLVCTVHRKTPLGAHSPRATSLLYLSQFRLPALSRRDSPAPTQEPSIVKPLSTQRGRGSHPALEREGSWCSQLQPRVFPSLTYSILHLSWAIISRAGRP